jgi:hypothetical protein
METEKGRGRLAPTSSRTSLSRATTSAYNGSEHAQVKQSSNGSNGQHASQRSEIRSGPIIKLIRYGDMRFTQVLQDSLRDHCLSFGARGLLAYLLSKPPNWQPLLWQIKQEAAESGYALSDYELSGYMRELRERGHARVVNTAKGKQWQVCEFPNPAWLEGEKAIPRISHDGNFEGYKNDRTFKNDTRARDQSFGRKEDQKSKGRAPAPDAFSLTGFKGKKLEIAQRFNKSFVPKGAQPITRPTPRLRKILWHHCLRADYEAFEQAALAGIESWPRKRPGFVALWHAYKPFGKDKRSAKTRFPDMNIAELDAAADRYREQSNELYRQDPQGTEKERAALEKEIHEIDEERARRINVNAERNGKAKTNVDALRTQRAARQREREHEAIKDKPIFPDYEQLLSAAGSNGAKP